MSDNFQGTVRCRPEDLQEAMSIHTKKITDSCRDKDCIEDLRVFLTTGSQQVLDSAAGAKVRCADLLYSYIDVEPVPFDRNHYCIDVTFYYRIIADTMVSGCRPTSLYGLAVFSKRAVLCGEESASHIFTSKTRINSPDGLSAVSSNLPTAVVEVLDPMVLSSKVREVCECTCDTASVQIPAYIRECFDEDLVLSGDRHRLFVTLGQFSIIRLERDAQLVVPVLDYSIPTKECCDSPGCGEEPCEMFSRIPFPTARFAPRNCDAKENCGYHTCGDQ